MTTHRLITPWPISAGIRTWCGLGAADAGDDHIATDPSSVTCPRCADSMRAALAQLSVDVPQLPPEVGS